MNKPDWKDAPDWAMWLAADLTDDDSRPEFWVWFETEPVWDHDGWLRGSMGGVWEQTKIKVPAGFNSAKSLEPRP